MSTYVLLYLWIKDENQAGPCSQRTLYWPARFSSCGSNLAGRGQSGQSCQLDFGLLALNLAGQSGQSSPDWAARFRSGGSAGEQRGIPITTLLSQPTSSPSLIHFKFKFYPTTRIRHSFSPPPPCPSVRHKNPNHFSSYCILHTCSIGFQSYWQYFWQPDFDIFWIIWWLGGVGHAAWVPRGRKDEVKRLL